MNCGRSRKFYLEAFPKSERKPFRLMKQKAAEGIMEFLSIRERGKLTGLAITVLYKDMVLFRLFCHREIFSGAESGNGSTGTFEGNAMKEGGFFFGNRTLSELEGPGQELRIRRKQFYLRNGMKETGVKVCLFQIQWNF